SVSFTLDTTISAAHVSLAHDTGANTADGLTKNASLSLSAVDADASRVIQVDGNVVAGYNAAVLADGAHTVAITDTDAAGNVSSNSVSFTLDTTIATPTVALSN